MSKERERKMNNSSKRTRHWSRVKPSDFEPTATENSERKAIDASHGTLSGTTKYAKNN